MRRFFFLPLFLLLLLLPACSGRTLIVPPCEKHVPPVVKEVPPVVVPVEVPKLSPVVPSEVTYENYLRASCRLRGGGSGGSGTCYKIDSQYVYILTCRHVVGRTKSFKAEFWIDGRITGAYSGRVSKVFDVDAAVILVSVNDFREGELPKAIPVSLTAPSADSPVIVSVGSPGLGWLTLFEGRIIGLDAPGNYNKSRRNIRFVPPPKGGRSGAGIFQDGKIIGILWGSTNKPGGAKRGNTGGGSGYAVASMYLKDLIEPGNFFFTAEWCKYCKEMQPIIQQLKEGGLDIRVVDYDLNTLSAKQHGVNALPAYINERGEVILGVKTAEELLEFYSPYKVPPSEVNGPE